MKKLLISVLFCAVALGDTKIPMEANKIYIIDFFASWCASCEKEIPILSQIGEKLKKQNIEIIGVDVDKNPLDGEKFQKKLQKHFTFKVINDTGNELINSYKPIGMPAIYIVKDNKTCGKIFGAVANLEEKINEQIKLCKEQK
jgi:cytochrome c biogenesis protein CcmG/thiol:disulfide interchange protein DsbE